MDEIPNAFELWWSLLKGSQLANTTINVNCFRYEKKLSNKMLRQTRETDSFHLHRNHGEVTFFFFFIQSLLSHCNKQKPVISHFSIAEFRSFFVNFRFDAISILFRFFRLVFVFKCPIKQK